MAEKPCKDCTETIFTKSAYCLKCKLIRQKARRKITDAARRPKKGRVKITLCPRCKEADKVKGRDYCQPCINSFQRDWYERVGSKSEEYMSKARANAQKYKPCPITAENTRLKHLYGITLAERETMVEQQDSKCKICNQVTDLNVDHCHVTGKVRGLLCRSCNTALGHFRDNEELLMNAIKYLKESKD